MSGMARDELDRRLVGFFDAASAIALPDGLLEDTYRVTRRIPQQRGPVARRLASLRAWWSAPFGAAPRLRVVLVVAIVLVTLTASLVYVAGHYRRLPPPYGPAGNGLIVFDLDQHLYIASPDGTAVPLDIGLGLSWNPAYSPDGTKLAFYSQADPPPSRVSLFVADADGTNARPITGDMAVVGDKLASIAWSPDSRRIAFSSRRRGVGSALYIAAADGSGVTRITDDDAVAREYPTWSPLGDKIAFQRVADGVVGLGIIAPDGSGESTLLRDDLNRRYNFAGPTWSPDGTKVAYQHVVRGSEQIGVYDMEAGKEVNVPETLPAEAPQWSNDGTRLAYFLTGDTTVAILDLATGIRTWIPHGLGDCGVYWSPDDSALLGIANCRQPVRFPIDDPGAVTVLTDVEGDLHMYAWQRVAP